MRMGQAAPAVLALAGMALAALAGAPAWAQRDPLGGQFGSIELALPPAEAAHQAELMGAALAGLQPQRPGIVDTYVLSASLWGEPVFENEAKEAAAILARHFDAEGRTIVLSAGRGGGARAYPAATPDNFNAALGKIGRTIDPNEDLVVVFVTSHGGPDGTVAMQEAGRMSGGLKPLHLRNSLAQAGIRNRVLIISACFSGNFILPFSDPNTMILTAAAADKTSFGCQPNREWTYFGDALFNHSLRSGASLASAYDSSLGLISKWEQKLVDEWEALPASQKSQQPKPEPSNPQGQTGDAVAPLVAKAEAYGMAVDCAGHLAFALDRARSSRALKGLTDPSTIQTARSATESRAIALASSIGRTSTDVARAIASASTALLPFYSREPAEVASNAEKCAATAKGP